VDRREVDLEDSASRSSEVERLEHLEGWLVAILRSVPPERMFGAVARAEREAGGRFPPRDVVEALRRMMSREPTRTLTRSSERR
jgi:hypothetical protein